MGIATILKKYTEVISHRSLLSDKKITELFIWKNSIFTRFEMRHKYYLHRLFPRYDRKKQRKSRKTTELFNWNISGLIARWLSPRTKNGSNSQPADFISRFIHRKAKTKGDKMAQWLVTQFADWGSISYRNLSFKNSLENHS